MFWGGGILSKEKSLEQLKDNENIELAIYINDEETNTIPSKNSGYVFNQERSSCTNGAYINWDNISWSPEISSMSEYKTRCTLYFKEALWREWIEKEPSIENDYATLTDFLANKEDTEKIFNSEDATAFLIENPSLIDEIKSDPNYMSETIESNVTQDTRSDLVNIILNSMVLTNEQKYQNDLPFYIFKDGKYLYPLEYVKTPGWCHLPYCPNQSNSLGETVYLYLNSHPNSCAGGTYNSSELLDFSKYKYSSVRFDGVANNTANSPYYILTIGTVSIVNSIQKYSGWISSNIEDLAEGNNISIRVYSCRGGTKPDTTTLTVYEWYIY